MTPGSPDPAVRTARVRMPDGRQVSYLDCGDPAGAPVLHFHGLPSSRWETHLGHAAAAMRGVRLICPDRPGIGESDPLPARGIADWPADAARLADALGLTRFAVLGVSGGTPYALACALQLRERIARVGIVSGLCPWPLVRDDAAVRGPIRLLAGLATRRPLVSRTLGGALATWVRYAPSSYFVLAWRAFLSPEDRAALTEWDGRATFRCMATGAFHQGGAAAALEARLLFSPWGLALETVPQEVAVWHGTADNVIPPAMAERLAQVLPRAVLHVAPGEGHFSVPLHRAREILTYLAG